MHVVLDRLVKIKRTILFVLCFFISIGMFVQGCRNVIRINSTLNWVSAQAIINVFEVDENNSPIIEYEFKVNEKTFKGNNISFESARGFKSRGEAKYYMMQLTKNNDISKIDVFYNPLNPHESSILKGEKRDEYILIVYACIFFIVSLILGRKIIFVFIKTISKKLIQNPNTK